MFNHDDLVGQKVWFPVQWEQAEVDSILTGTDDDVIAYILRRENGQLVAIDVQMREIEGFNGELQ
jgi:hypothetical protein